MKKETLLNAHDDIVHLTYSKIKYVKFNRVCRKILQGQMHIV
jgi:hypothetical protein